MAIISGYPTVTPSTSDHVLGTQVVPITEEIRTVQFTLGSIAAFQVPTSLTFAGDTGAGTVALITQTFTVGGTANEIKTSSTGQTLSISLADGAYNATPAAGTNLELPDGSAAITQTAGDNTRKVATTAFVTAAIATSDTLAEVLANGNTTGGTDLAVSAGDDITFTPTSALKGETINIENAAGTASYLILNSTGGTFAGDLTVSGGDITSNGLQIISNSTTASTLLIGDVTLGDTIQEMRLQVYGADLINLQDNEVSLKSNIVKVTGSLSTTAPATYLGLLSSTGVLTKRTPTQVLADISGDLIKINASPGVELYYSTTKRLETAANGVQIYGGLGDVNTTLGTAGQVLSSTGAGILWADASGGSLNSLTDCLVTANSIFLGNDPTATWNNALYNSSVGITSLSVITTGDNNTVMGYDAGRSITEGSGNVLIGKDVGELITTGLTNVMVGYLVGKSIVDGGGNIVLGSSSFDLTAGDTQNQIVIGNSAGRVLDTFKHNICIGNYSGNLLTSGGWNTLIGYNAGNKLTSGGDNTIIGSDAGKDVTGSDNTLVGRYAGTSMTTGSGSVLIGNEAGKLLTTGNYNVAIGSKALESANAGTYSVAIGFSSLNDQNLGTPGAQANNTAVGAFSGSSITSGIKNTILGTVAGSALTTGSNNTLIGYNAEPDGAIATNQTVIGYSAVGHGDNITVIGNASNTAIHPGADNVVDLGSTTYSFKDSHIQGTSNAGGFKVDAMQAVPASATATGTVGDIRFTASAIYVCVATDTWKKADITTF